MPLRAMLSLFLLLSLLLVSGVSSASLPRKQLAGPPSEFSLYQIPDPLSSAIEENSALIVSRISSSSQIKASPSDAESIVMLSIDSRISFSFSVYVPEATQYTLVLSDPNGQPVNITQHVIQGSLEFGSSNVASTTYEILHPIIGQYSLKIVFKNVDWSSIQDSTQVAALIYVQNESQIQILSRAMTYHQVQGSQIGLVAQLINAPSTQKSNRVHTSHPQSILADQVVAFMSVLYPNGTIQNVPMYDDGLHSDLSAEDGIYGGEIEATASGFYLAQSNFNVTLSDGTNIYRTSQHVLASVSTNLSINQNVPVSADLSEEVITFSVPVNDPNDDSNTYRIYAEIWGTPSSSSEELQAAAWAATLTEVVEGTSSTSDSLKFQLDAKWLSASNLVAPLQLRNVVVQDVSTYVIVSTASSLNVTMNSQTSLLLAKVRFNGEITEEMRKGKRPAKFFTNSSVDSSDASGAFVLVHGYCSAANPWQQYASEFTNPYFFLSADSNDLNDAFAQKIAAFAEEQGLTKFSAVGYSQGGLALLHLSNYYWSGVDLLEATPENLPNAGSRALQSLVSPYQGSSASGNIAGIGKFLGVGCGTNYDLTKDGAKLWLAGVASDTRASMWYYYVSFASNPAYCNRASNMFLAKPNDGAVETTLAVLPGGNLAGFTEGECHSNDMQYPAAFTDSARNKDINAQAARF